MAEDQEQPKQSKDCTVMREGLKEYEEFVKKIKDENPGIKRNVINEFWREYKIKTGKLKPKIKREKKNFVLKAGILYVCEHCGKTFEAKDIKEKSENESE